MKYKFILIVCLLFSLNGISQTLYDFNENSKRGDWRIVDDVVMGGRSSGSFTINEKGIGVFSGDVSLENNGGFSSIRYYSGNTSVEGYDKISILLKGDRKKYQFRIKHNSSDYYSFLYEFQTSGEWEEIDIPFNEMYASFRGRRLNISNFSEEKIEEMAILIGNKKNESFKLLLDKIEMKN